MKALLHGKNRIGIALFTVVILGLTPGAILADETDAGLHAGVGSFFAAVNETEAKNQTTDEFGAGVHNVLTGTVGDAELGEIVTDEPEGAGDALADEGELMTQDDLIMIETDQEETEQIAMANVADAVNVRVEPTEDAPIAGKLYANCGGTILEQRDGWTRIQSGELTGWAKDEFLLFGEEARALYDQVVTMEARVTTDTLRIRMDADEEAGVLDLIAGGEVLSGIEDQGDWVSVKYDGQTGYVSSEYVDLTYSVPSGKTVEQIEAEEKAKAEKAAAEAAAKEKEKKKKSSKTTTTDQGAVASASNDVMLLAALIQCEAGRESYEGQLAVGAVVMNRVRSGSYPGSVSGVINQPSQFPPATNGRVAGVLASGPSSSCVQAAQAAIGGQSNVGGATHFGRSGSGVQIGNHNFW